MKKLIKIKIEGKEYGVISNRKLEEIEKTISNLQKDYPNIETEDLISGLHMNLEDDSMVFSITETDTIEI